MSMTCPFCRAEIPDDSWFCDQCGKELHFCPECGKPKRGTGCAACGADLVGAKDFFCKPEGAAKGLFLVGDSGRIALREGVFGRTQGVFPEFSSDRYVSGRHGEFRCKDGAWQVQDLGSTNGTFINSHRLSAGQWAGLTPGDELKIAISSYKISL